MDFATTVKRYNNRLGPYHTYRAYSRGEHELKFTSGDFEKETGKEMKSMRENLCGAVISAFVDRLGVTSWGSTANDKIAEDLGLDRILNVANSEAFRCGTSYAFAADYAGEKVIVTQRAEQVVPETDDLRPDRLAKATRFWVDKEGYPRISVFDTMYVEELIGQEKLQTNTDTGEITSRLFPTEEMQYNSISKMPHGFPGVVPCVQWKQDSDSAYDEGVSILADVIPLQDALNKSLVDSIVLGASYSRPFWFLLNYKPNHPDNPLLAARQLANALNTQIEDYQIANGPESRGDGPYQGKFNRGTQSIFTHDGPGPFGQLDPPDIAKLLDLQDRFALKIARVVGMPSYYITQTSGDVPSGSSLRVLSQRMTARVGRFQLDSNPVLKGLGELLGMTDPKPVWADAAPMDLVEKMAIAAQKKNQLGYTMADAIAGLDEPDAEGIVQRAEAKAEKERYDAERGGFGGGR